MSYFKKTVIGIRTVAVLFKQSLSGQIQDYTKGSIGKAVFLLSIPMILEMCMESVFAVVDIFFVGRIGKEAVATVGLTESVLTIVYTMAIGLGMAATAMVARRIGEKKPGEAARCSAQAILISIILSALISVCGLVFASSILRLMGAPPSVVILGSSFTKIIFAGSVVIMLLHLINGIFRGAGNAAIAMWSLWIANGCNIILCPLLIHFYGLKGAAFATTIGRGVGVCYQLYHLFGGSGTIRILRRYFIPDLTIIRNLFSIAWTGILQFLIGSASWIILNRIAAKFGSEAIAGYQVAMRVLLFFLLPAWGMSNAAATLVGQNLGAGQPGRAEQSVWTTAKFVLAFMCIVSLLLLFASKPIILFMNRDAGVDKIGIQALRIVSTGYIFYGLGMVMMNAFNGAGDTRTPTIINFFCFWTFQIPIAYLMAIKWQLGPKGVFLAIVLAEVAVSISGLILFRKGRWKKVKI
jgi:putative MATE family efflux protein